MFELKIKALLADIGIDVDDQYDSYNIVKYRDVEYVNCLLENRFGTYHVEFQKVVVDAVEIALEMK